MSRMTFKQWRFECEACGKITKKFQWDYDPLPVCAECGGSTHHEHVFSERATAVLGDEIDVTIKHGPCNPDGTPRRYTSRAELKRESEALGWTPDGDTPHPARITGDRR